MLGALTALVLGIPVAYAIVRYQFRGKDMIEVLFSSPAIVPGIVVGSGAVALFRADQPHARHD